MLFSKTAQNGSNGNFLSEVFIIEVLERNRQKESILLHNIVKFYHSSFCRFFAFASDIGM